MSDALFPSGQWFGFYTYANHPKRFLMDLVLEFKNGIITGEGADGIGVFVITGGYDAANSECTWLKQYVGRHAVDYRGFREAKGIWGTWKIGVGHHGGFQIWPLGEGEPLSTEETAEEATATAPVTIAQPVPATKE